MKDYVSKIVEKLLNRISGFSFEGSNGSVHIKDVQRTHLKVQTMLERGSSALQVVSDFDQTMSKYIHNNKRVPTCHGIFCDDPEVTESTRVKLKQLVDKYHPIEIDANIPDDEKIPVMLDWWEKTHEIIVNCCIHRDTLKKVVNDSEVTLRDGVQELMSLLHDHRVPMLIFSAGLGDVIELLLQRFALSRPNVRVISNFMIFNDEDVLVGFTTPIIHTFNKTAATVTNGQYGAISSTRPCVLLFGDSTGDVHMADGATVEDPDGTSGTVLRIGFLNDATKERLELYKSIYDIVIANDETFTIPLMITQSILQGAKGSMSSFT